VKHGGKGKKEGGNENDEDGMKYVEVRNRGGGTILDEEI
jgi:hypothetical protein